MSTDNMIFNVSDYLTEDDMKRIATEEFRAACGRSSKENFERIISNSAYHLVGDLVDAHFNGEMVETLKAKAIEVINNLSTHTVFSPPSAWERAASKGFEHLQTLLDDQKPLIAQRLTDLISTLDGEYLRDMVERQVGEAIIAKLTRGEA